MGREYRCPPQEPLRIGLLVILAQESEETGSTPVVPEALGVQPSGKATDFDSVIRRFNPCHPCHPGRQPTLSAEFKRRCCFVSTMLKTFRLDFLVKSPICGGIVQSVNTSAFHAEDARFESACRYHKEAGFVPLKRSPLKEPNDAVGTLGIGRM